MIVYIYEMQTHEVFFSNRLRAVSYFSLQSYSTHNPPEYWLLLHVVVIHNFCYHGNVTSHFPPV